jgi:DNA repair protein RadB
MINKRLAFGQKPLDDLLGGGIEHKSLTNLYGPPGCGKTNIALLASVSAVKNEKKLYS